MSSPLEWECNGISGRRHAVVLSPITRLFALGGLVLILQVVGGPGQSSGHGSSFSPLESIQLCDGLAGPCVENLGIGADADTTLSFSWPSGQMLPSGVVTFLPQSASIPGPETNQQCADSTDNDGDGVTNEGCPPVGYDVESNQCENAFNDDFRDDTYVNDGCPAFGPPESVCDDTTNADSDGDSRVNDGCPAVGSVLAESNAWCTNSTDEDPRDDAAGGGVKVNDGCPAVGPAETACDDAVDDDGDTKVNDGCYPGGFGGTESESQECLDSVDNDQDGYVNDGCDEPATTRPPAGAVAGKVVANPVTFGVVNATCSTQVSIEAAFFNSTTENALWNEYGLGDPHPYGAMGPFREDYDGDGLPTHVDRYPEFLNQMFDPDRVGDINRDGDDFDTVDGVVENPGASPLNWYGTVEPLRPVARYSATTIVSSTALLFQMVVFSPGAFAAYQKPHPFSDFASPAFGYPAVFVLQAPTADPAPGPLTAICSPANLTILLWGHTRDNPCTGGATCNATCINEFVSGGQCPAFDDSGAGACAGLDEANCGRYANPLSTGVHHFGLFQWSPRESDGDGLENGLDTCPWVTNLENPRASAGPDGDMLDSACDPGPGTPNANQDGDSHPTGGQWLNGQDNCPLAANPDQKESERDQPHSVSAPRGGSRLDGMGDACELAETTCGASVDDDADGLVNDGCPAVGSVAAEGVCTYSTSAEVDNDFDGYPNDGCPQGGATAESGADCKDFVNDDFPDDVLVNDGCPATGGGERGCLNSADDDADGAFNDGCPSSAKVGTGHFHSVFKLIPKCIGGVDQDFDGYCTIGGSSAPGDPNDGDVNKIPETYSQFRPFVVAHAGSGTNPPAAREPPQVCNDGIDNDGDTLIDLLDGQSSGSATTDDCRPPDSIFTTGVDTDGDGSKDEVEIHLGTDPLSRCGRGFEATGLTPSSAWPMDLRGESTFSGDKISLSDLGTFISPYRRIGTSPGDANFDRRWDVRPGSTVGHWISISDLAAVSTNNPVPMLGVRAYGLASVCSAHPLYGD